MLTLRHFSKIALILALLLVWTQQMVVAHSVVHPYQDGGSQKKLPGSHSSLCDLCVISALDNAPTSTPDFGLASDATHVQLVQPVVSHRTVTPYRYQSRAPPSLPEFAG